ncbi:MAG: NAD(P)-binding domain-containing protein [Planctomycetota bacterium]
MKIAFIGYGSMAEALGVKWAEDHELSFAGRSREKATALANRIGHGAVSRPSVVDASTWADVVVLATRHEAIPLFIDELVDSTRRKTVIDINNPVVPPNFNTSDTYRPSLAEWIAARLPDARVVKAFNQCQASVWAHPQPVFGGQRLAVPICGDDADSKSVVSALIDQVGCDAVDFGRLDRSAALEAMASMVIQLLHTGHDLMTVFNLIRPEK